MHAMIFCGAMLIVAIFGILLLSRRINYNRQMEQIDHYTMELAERTAQHVGDVFEAKRDAISSMAYLYGKGLDSAQVDQEQLRELEEDGLVSRRVFPVVPPMVEYELTEFGQTVRPILTEMRDWGRAYLDGQEKPSDAQ